MNEGGVGGDLYPKIRHSVNEQIPIASHIASDAAVLIGYVNDNVLRRAQRVRRLCSHMQSVKKVWHRFSSAVGVDSKIRRRRSRRRLIWYTLCQQKKIFHASHSSLHRFAHASHSQPWPPRPSSISLSISPSSPRTLHPCRKSATKSCKRKSPAASTLVRTSPRIADPQPPACRPLHHHQLVGDSHPNLTFHKYFRFPHPQSTCEPPEMQ